MKISNRSLLCIFSLLILLSGSIRGADLTTGSVLAFYDSRKEEYREADRILNEARFTTADKQKASVRLKELTGILSDHPEYPFTGMVYYFIGINRRIVEDYSGAVQAFRKALELNPELKDKTPVEAFIDESLQTWRKQWIPKLLWVVFCLFLLGGTALIILYPPDGATLKNGLKLSGILLAGWIVVFFISAGVSSLSGPDTLEGYPKPVLVQSGLGALGGGLLWAWFLYGLLAAAACSFLCLTTHWIKSENGKLVLNLALCVLVSGLCMVLFYMGHLYSESSFNSSIAGGRFNVLTKEIVFKNEIPEEMFKLYDKDFAERLKKELEEKKETE